MRWAITVFYLWAFVATAQQIGQNAPQGSTGAATFTTGTQLVVETVVVKDKKGNPVEGLTAKDFAVTEDGVPQAIRFLEYQKVEPVAAPAAPFVPQRLHI